MTVPTNNNDDPTTNAPDEGTSPDHAIETARILDAVLMTERGKYWRKLAKEAIDEAEKEAQRLLDQGASRADAAKTDKQKRDALQHAEDAAARVRRSAAARAEGYEAKIRSMFDRALKDAEKIAREEARIQAMRQAEQDRKDRIARGELEDYEAALTCYVFNAKDCRYINRNTRETLKAEAVDRLHLSQMPAGARGGRPRPTEVYDSLPDTVVDRVKDMLYMPGQDFIVELRKGEETIKVANSYTPDRHPAAQGDISMLLQLVDHLCDGREFEKNYVMDWMAFVYQNHGVQLKQAILMHGKFGGGKDSLFEIMSAMLGANGGSVKPHDLMGNRQTWVQSKEFVSVSEIAGAGLGDRDGYETLKQIITNPVLPIDPKFRDHVEARNSVNFMFGSNHNDAIRMEPGDRRFFVIHNKRPSLEETFGKEWVGAFAEWRKSEDGLAAIAYFLKNRKITLVRPGECPPMNQDKLDMQKATQTGPEAWMVDGIESRRAPFDRDLLTYSEIVEALQQRFRGKDFTWAWVAKTLTLVPDAGKLKDDADKDVKVTLKGKDYNCWAVRNLSFYRTAPNATRANSLDGRPTGAPDIDEAGWRMPKAVKLLTDDEIAKLNKLIADAKDRRDRLSYEYLRYQLRLDERAKKKQAAA